MKESNLLYSAGKMLQPSTYTNVKYVILGHHPETAEKIMIAVTFMALTGLALLHLHFWKKKQKE